MRALVVTNMYPSARFPAVGPFVADQVEALRRQPGIEVQLFAFDPGPRNLLRAFGELRRAYKGQRFDVVHAHFGLSAWPALCARLGPVVLTMHGTDLRHPITKWITRAALPFTRLPAVVSRSLAQDVPGTRVSSAHRVSSVNRMSRARRISGMRRRRVAILPCGVNTDRFRPLSKSEARSKLGLDVDGRYLLFPQDPARAVKRFDRAQTLADGVDLLTLGSVAPEEVPLWINAANAVLVPSEKEGFGLAVLEALACNIPVLATPVGIHPLALSGIEGTLCAQWDQTSWLAVLKKHLEHDDPRIDGRSRAQLFSAERMAQRVVRAWGDLIN